MSDEQVSLQRTGPVEEHLDRAMREDCPRILSVLASRFGDLVQRLITRRTARAGASLAALQVAMTEHAEAHGSLACALAEQGSADERGRLADDHRSPSGPGSPARREARR